MRFADLAGRAVAVWGAGREGRSALRAIALHAAPSSLIGVEDDGVTRAAAEQELREGGPDVDLLGGAPGRAALGRAEVIVCSPGISRYRADVAEHRAKRVVTNATALALPELAASGRRVVGVTGSKGKSTTTALTRHLLHLAGHDVEEGGNIGRPALDLLDAPCRVCVLEVSSYQASEVESSPPLGVLTSLFPEHLDWHGDVETYYRDKLRLFRFAELEALAVNARDPEARTRTAGLPQVLYGHAAGVDARDGALWHGDRLLARATERITGEHNLLNAAAALTAAGLVDPSVLDAREVLEEWLTTFAPLPHRLETIATVAGVEYVDDSIATSPGATIAALDAFRDRAVTLLVGGHERSVPYEGLADHLAARAGGTLVCTMPTSGDRLADLLDAGGPSRGLRVVRCGSLAEAVAVAAAETAPGGVVLLSPAAASYDRFTSYAHRGNEFRRLVEAVAAAG